MSKKITTEMFIAKAREIHGDRYDYSKVSYSKAKTPVCIICKIHGEFWQAPDKHLHNHGCERCSRPNSKLTNEEFIEKANDANGGKYDYSLTHYVGYSQKVTVICPRHGAFEIWAKDHLRGIGCAICGGSKRYDKQRFIEKHKRIWGDKYDYSLTDLDNRENDKICVTCPEHGPYYKTISDHWTSGCPTCSSSFSQPLKAIKRISNSKSLTTKDFIHLSVQMFGEKFSYEKTIYKGILVPVIVTCQKHGDIEVCPNNFLRGHGCKRCACEEHAKLQIKQAAASFLLKARAVHGDKYSYDKVEYKNARDKVCITCPTHGDFWQSPNKHLSGCGCVKCSPRTWPYTVDEYVEIVKKVHGDRYSYDHVVWTNTHTNITVTCPEHGDFEISPEYHRKGGQCPVCVALKIESTQEHEVREMLERHQIRYNREHVFPWLRRGRVMPLDFYLQDYNVAIECQGIQHYISNPWFGGQDGLRDIEDRDALKKHLCKEHGVRLLYYSDLKIPLPEDVYKNLSGLYNAIIDVHNKRKNLQYMLDFSDL